jgi:hypothetical protein
MDLFPFPNGHFVYVNDVHRLVMPLLITPAVVLVLVTNAYQKVYEFLSNYFDEIMFAVSLVSVAAMFMMFRAFDELIDKIIKKYTNRIQELESEIKTRRFSQRLLERREKMENHN